MPEKKGAYEVECLPNFLCGGNFQNTWKINPNRDQRLAELRRQRPAFPEAEGAEFEGQSFFVFCFLKKKNTAP